MKAVDLGELRELLESAAFAAWWAEWQRAASDRDDARVRHGELAAQAELMTLRSEHVRRSAAERRALAGEHDDAGAARATSLERSLIRAEHDALAGQLRREAERLSAEAEERGIRARQLAGDAATALRELGEAEARLAALRAEAGERFGCAPGLAFLYWRHPGDGRSAFAVSLADQPEGAGPAARALGVYVVGRQRGVAVLEPARDGAGPGARREGGRTRT